MTRELFPTEGWRGPLYRLVATGAGLGWLVGSLWQHHASVLWGVVAVFALLSLLVKRAGFRVTAEVTHSLVNVVDVGAVLVLGPLGGALVAALSSILHVQLTILRRPRWHPRDLIDLPLFDGGVKALLALAGGTFYFQAGGTVAPTMVTLPLLLPLTLLFFFWFSLDHLLWVWLFLLGGGVERARQFLQRISLASLLIELAPLPFSVAFAVAWVLFDPLLRVLLVLGMMLVALVVRGFARALRRAEEQVETVSLLNKFGQALVLAQLDEEKLSRLLFDYAARLLQGVRFELILLDEESDPPWRAVLPQPGDESQGAALMGQIAPMMRERPHGRLLPTLSTEALAEEMTRAPEERPQRGCALLMPLLASDELLGIFLAESQRPAALTLDDGRSLSVLATQAAVALQSARRYRREEWRARQLQAIAEVSRMVASVLDLDEFLWRVVDLICDTFGYYHVQIYLVTPETGEVIFRAGSGPAGRELARQQRRLQLSTEGIIGWVAGQGEPLLVNDVSRDPRYIPDNVCLLPNTRAELAVPLKIEERVLGVLDVQSDRVNEMDEEDCFMLATLADQIAIALEEARLYMAEREEAWLTMSLLDVAEALNPLLERASVLETIVRVAPPLVGADAAAIFLWQGEAEMFEGAAAYALDPPVVKALMEQWLAPEQFPLLEVVREQQQVVFVERSSESDLVPDFVTQFIGNMALIGAPLLAQGGFVGVLLLGHFGSPRPLSARRGALLSGITQQAAVAIQAANLYTAQEEEAAITRDLLQVSQKIASGVKVAEVLELVTRLAVTTTEAAHCAVYLWQPEAGRLVPAQAYGFPPEIEAAWRHSSLVAAEAPFLPALMEAVEPLVLGEGGDQPLDSEPLYALFGAPVLIGAPLRAGDDFLGLMIVDGIPGPSWLPRRLSTFLTGIARQLSVALENAVLYEEALENERRTQELVLARQIQTALLPDRAPDLPGYDLAGYWRPAREVAGDFYDFLPLSHNRWAFSIADVADKGIGAALFMVLTRTALRESIWHEEDAGRALQRTNSVIAADVRGGMFLTIFLAILAADTGHLQAANAGHLPPLIFRAANKSLVSTVRRSLPLGILPDTAYESFELTLEPGDFVVLITDGIMDTINSDREPFGLQRLSELVYQCHDLDATALVHAILDAATAHAAGEPFEDDLTIVVVRRVP